MSYYNKGFNDRIRVLPASSEGVSELKGRRFYSGEPVIKFYDNSNCTGAIILEDIDELIKEVKENLHKDNYTIGEYEHDSGLDSKFSITTLESEIDYLSLYDEANCNVCGEKLGVGDKIVISVTKSYTDAFSMGIHSECWHKFEDFIQETKNNIKNLQKRIFHRVYIRELDNLNWECARCGKTYEGGVHAKIGRFKTCTYCLESIIDEIKGVDYIISTEHVDVHSECIICGGGFKDEYVQFKIDSMRKVIMHKECKNKFVQIPEDSISKWQSIHMADSI